MNNSNFTGRSSLNNTYQRQQFYLHSNDDHIYRENVYDFKHRESIDDFEMEERPISPLNLYNENRSNRVYQNY
jgi:hypothetical protein